MDFLEVHLVIQDLLGLLPRVSAFPGFVHTFRPLKILVRQLRWSIEQNRTQF